MRAADSVAAEIKELREKEAHVVEMMHRNELIIANMESLIQHQAVALASTALRSDKGTATSEDFRENWVSQQPVASPATGNHTAPPSVASQPELAILALERRRDGLQALFDAEREAFTATIFRYHEEMETLREVVKDRLRDRV